ncbi:MAG TPA: hypothetical protein PK191_00450 [Niabella sp.]|nr:hypothetical protein [Niabella sp.]HQW13248.1 hypothetical protein [Niabella sp.]HRB79164.1 hypothetical protein [Niabella sp.]HRC02055.1 hypothetical protein [Niabella sp.]HRC03634.1 hypothetical protein [Niabella sp.]
MLLTIGLPVTYNAVKKMQEKTSTSKIQGDNPYSNSTEEKTPSNNISISEEYAHEEFQDFSISLVQVSTAFIHAHEATYLAFHKELHCPPPNILS